MERREEFILDLHKLRSINCLLESVFDQTESKSKANNTKKKNNSVKPVTMNSISSIKYCHTSNLRKSTSPIYQIYFSESLDSGDGDMFLCKIGWVLPCEVYKCMQCKLIFDSNNCKQHCYACGEIVCQSCCKYSAILKSCGYLTSDLWQVCNVCFESKDEDDIVAIGRNEEAVKLNISPVRSATGGWTSPKQLLWSNYFRSSNSLLTPFKTVLYNRQNLIKSLLQPEVTYSSFDNTENEARNAVDDTDNMYNKICEENFRNNDLLNHNNYVSLSSIMSFNEERANICSVDVFQSQIEQQNPSEFHHIRVTSSVDYINAFVSYDDSLCYSKSFVDPVRFSTLTDDWNDYNNMIQNNNTYLISNSDDKCNELFRLEEYHIIEKYFISDASDLSLALEYRNSLFTSNDSCNSQTVDSSIGDNDSNCYGDETTREVILEIPYDVSELLYFDSNQNHQNVSNNDNSTNSSIDTNSSNYNDHLPLLTLASVSIKDQFASNIQNMNKRDLQICEEGQLNHRNNYDNFYNDNNDRKSHYSDTGRTDSESIRPSDMTVNSNTTYYNQINNNDAVSQLIFHI
eukprot:gene14394-19320_t